MKQTELKPQDVAWVKGRKKRDGSRFLAHAIDLNSKVSLCQHQPDLTQGIIDSKEGLQSSEKCAICKGKVLEIANRYQKRKLFESLSKSRRESGEEKKTLSQALRQKSMSYGELAQALGKDRTTYHHYASGRRLVPVQEAIAISEFLKVKVEDIWWGKS